MGTFGQEFFNVLALAPDGSQGPVGFPAEGEPVGPALQTIIDRAANYPAVRPIEEPLRQFRVSGGGIVYLPPRNYIIGRDMTLGSSARDAVIVNGVETALSGTDFMRKFHYPELRIYPNVLLWFAPGARLILGSEVVIRIDGSIRAEETQIFDAGLPTPRGERRARVVFYTTKVAEVYPEWWGANGLGNADDANALSDCFIAAHTNRAFPTYKAVIGPGEPTIQSVTLPPLPVVMRGTYSTSRELVVAQQTDRRFFSGLPYGAGFTLQGRRGTGSGGAGRPALQTIGLDFRTRQESEAKGRALLRIDAIQGCLIEGVSFDGNFEASACAQITGTNAFNCVFRNCAFVNARHVLMQVGDYVIEEDVIDATGVNGSSAMTPPGYGDRPLPVLKRGINGGWDLSGLTFDNCLFQSGVTSHTRNTRAPVGLMFHAANTLPMTLEGCLFKNAMLACIEAYGGAMIIRGGNAQNWLEPNPYVPLPFELSIGQIPRRDRPRGGVDIFIGDPLLILVVNPDTLAVTTFPTSPTGVTVLQFESQSDQFLDTFRHQSASANFVPFFPTLFQNVSARRTRDGTAAASVYWSGPGLWNGPGGARSGPPSNLTLVGCVFGGVRMGQPDVQGAPGVEPSGGVVIDSLAYSVGDVNTRASQRGSVVFWQVERFSDVRRPQYTPVPASGMGDMTVFNWYRQM